MSNSNWPAQPKDINSKPTKIPDRAIELEFCEFKNASLWQDATIGGLAFPNNAPEPRKTLSREMNALVERPMHRSNGNSEEGGIDVRIDPGAGKRVYEMPRRFSTLAVERRCRLTCE